MFEFLGQRHNVRPQRQHELPQAVTHPRWPLPPHSSQRQLQRKAAAVLSRSVSVYRYVPLASRHAHPRRDVTVVTNACVNVVDKVREANGCVLVHCLAGISRSPTLAIAYIMRSYNMASEEAYRFVALLSAVQPP